MNYLQKRRDQTGIVASKKKLIHRSNRFNTSYCMSSVTIMPPMYNNSTFKGNTKKKKTCIIPSVPNHAPNIFNTDQKYLNIYENICNDITMSKEDKMKEYNFIQEIVNLSQIRKNLCEEVQKELVLKELILKAKEIDTEDTSYERIQNMCLFGEHGIID